MKLFLGIDGGGTHTTARLADDSGNLVGSAECGVGNPNHVNDEDLKAHFASLIEELFGKTGLSAEQCASAFAGMAGVTCEETAIRIRRVLEWAGLGHAVIGVDHDIRIALAGGLALRPGIALIVGTGSSCYGRDSSGRTWQTGGWGALIADEGSGYSLGRDAIKAAVQMSDGRQEETALKRSVFQWLGITDVSEILERIYGENLSRPEIASFAPTVLELAGNGDSACLAILTDGAEELGRMVYASHSRLPTSPRPEVVITGGLGTADSCYRDMIESAINRHLPEARITLPELDTTCGAVLLAMEQTGHNTDSLIVNQLKDSK